VDFHHTCYGLLPDRNHCVHGYYATLHFRDTPRRI
jgi:hypothetical protein